MLHLLFAAVYYYWLPVALSYSPDTNTAVVAGRVFDELRRPLAGATIVIHSNGDAETTRTDARGRYIFFHLKPADYDVTPQSDGYRICPGERSYSAELTGGSRFEWDLQLFRHCR